MKASNADIAAVAEAVQASRKYASICEPVVRRLAMRELQRSKNVKEAAKQTRNRLHQVAGAYLDIRMPYNVWSAALSPDSTAASLRAWKLEVMRHHASTRERLSDLEQFYKMTLGSEKIGSVLDLACGLNPIATDWMPLKPECRYRAVDMYRDMAAFLNVWFAYSGMDGCAEATDLLAWEPEEEFEIALALKVVSPLEQQESGAGIALLRRIRAWRILVSFPTRTLGGRNVQMATNYEGWFRAKADQEGWRLEKTLFPSELCFVVTKGRV